MRKRIFSLIVLMATLSVAYAQKSPEYKVSGKVDGMDSGWVWMKTAMKDHIRTLDSARIENGKFSFQGKLDKGIQAVNLYFNRERGSLVLFLEPGKIAINAHKDSLYYAYVTGTPNNERWGQYVREDRRLVDEGDRMSKLYQESFKTKNRDQVKTAERNFAKALADRKQMKADFLANPENKYMTVYLYRSSMMHKMQFHEIDSLIQSFGKDMEQNNDYQLLLVRREITRLQAVGQPFGDVRLMDAEGNECSLADLKGKWVLVDFWASWCAPCRQEGKHVLELYKKYHDKGFEVFGISIDQNPGAWRQAILEDQTPWVHVLDAKGQAARKYGITAIPQLFLLNPEGKVEAINIRGGELTKKLESIYPEG